MDIESIAGDIVIELDYLLRRLHGSMILDWNYMAAKSKVAEVLERRLTPAAPDRAIGPQAKGGSDNPPCG
jgi:hypothetical protein